MSRLSKYILLSVLAMLLSACITVQPEPQGPWNEWICDSQIKIYWRPDGAAGQAIQLRLGAGDMLHILKRMPSNSGELYSDSQVAFEVQGEQAQVYTINGHNFTGRNCKAQSE